MKLIIHTDGGARGNPGPAAIGVVIESETDKKTIKEFGKKIGETTNNVAEYTAVIEALEWMRNNISREESKNNSVTFYLDSTLVVNQVNGFFKVKDAKLRELLVLVHQLEAQVDSHFSYKAVPREQNRRADFLVNQALDS